MGELISIADFKYRKAQREAKKSQPATVDEIFQDKDAKLKLLADLYEHTLTSADMQKGYVIGVYVNMLDYYEEVLDISAKKNPLTPKQEELLNIFPKFIEEINKVIGDLKK